jgi:hypothetical protein
VIVLLYFHRILENSGKNRKPEWLKKLKYRFSVKSGICWIMLDYAGLCWIMQAFHNNIP